MKTPHFLRAFTSRNYRLYFGGQCVSLFGNWMTATASLWLAYHLSGDPASVGLVGFANSIPVLLLAPFAGVGVDRVNRLRVLQVTQVFSMLQSAALATLTLTGQMTVPRLVGLCLFQGVVNSFDWPARQALNLDLAGDRAHLDNVVALNSITFNLARLVGPAVAGFVIAGLGPGFCYALDALSFLAVLAALSALRLTPRPPRTARSHPLADLRDGFRYAWAAPAIRITLLMVPVISLVGFTPTVLGPVFARDVYFGDARLLGFLLAATGVGAVAAGLFLTVRPKNLPLGRVIAWGAALNAAGLILLGSTTWLPLALLSLVAAGGGGVLVMASANSLVQLLVTDDKRGRVMSLYTMGQAAYPVGSLLVGFLAAAAGPRIAVALCGAVSLGAALVYGRTRRGDTEEAAEIKSAA